ncbi:fibronectin type III domain-containing protein [Candidatus Micrarchaeota archaeon]|nr:fibronectin type III domain-containing protein [Candidatus Micrarchaeota archaeon]
MRRLLAVFFLVLIVQQACALAFPYRHFVPRCPKCEQALAASSILILGLSVNASEFDDSVTVSWRTNRPSSSYLVLWQEGVGGVRPYFDSSMNLSHSFRLESFAPNTTYRFYVQSSASGWPAAISDTRQFTTPESLRIFNESVEVSPFGTEAVLRWQTSRLSTSGAEFWCNGGLYENKSDDSLTTSHEIAASRLHVGNNCEARFWSTRAAAAVSSRLSFDTPRPGLLLVLSPDFANDSEVQVAAGNYLTAVFFDLRWQGYFLGLNASTNNAAYIDEVITRMHSENNVLAVVAVGDDLAFPRVEVSYVTPMLDGWSNTTRPSDAYLRILNTSVAEWVDWDVVVSLVVPTSTCAPYCPTKQAKAAAVLRKFAANRTVDYGSRVELFRDPSFTPDLDGLDAFENVSEHTSVSGSALAYVSCSAEACPQLAMLVADGHGNPGTVSIPPGQVNYLDIKGVNVPLVILSGCDTAAWFHAPGMSTPVNQWFGDLVTESNYVRAVIAGSPLVRSSLEIDPDPASVISYAVPRLAAGKPLAEALWGSRVAVFYPVSHTGSTIVVFGDPTFHYNPSH